MYAVNLNLQNKICVVLGGGPVAYRKISQLIKSNATIKLISTDVCNEILELVTEKKIEWIRKNYDDTLPHGFIFIAATNDPKINDKSSIHAKNLGMLVNNVTNANLSDFTVPSTIQYDNFSIAISTENISPGFSKFIRQQLQKDYPPTISEFMNRLHKIRVDIKSKIPDTNARQTLWRLIFKTYGDQILQLIRDNKIDEAEELIKHAACNDWTESSNGNS